MEAMALESLVASVWRLEGFLAVARHPVRVTRGYSDVDVIGTRGDGAVRIAECKARGPARLVNVDDAGQGWTCWWDGSLNNLGRLWTDRPPWLPDIPNVTSLEFHLVGNVWFSSPKSRMLAEKRLARAARQVLPRALRTKATAVVRPSVELVMDAIRIVQREVVVDGWGKRYGDPLLDAIRELVRYAHPCASGGGRTSSAISAAIRESLVSALFDGK